jgi:pimeloyl-ACP methyl ester carboxylesterase
VVLVGHSAGGWLARAVLADGTWMAGNSAETSSTDSSDLVCGLVTLGAPHFPPREVYYTLYTIYYTLYTIHYIHYTHYTLYTTHYTLTLNTITLYTNTIHYNTIH